MRATVRLQLEGWTVAVSGEASGPPDEARLARELGFLLAHGRHPSPQVRSGRSACNQAMAHAPIDRHRGPTKNMSVRAWRVTMANCGMVPSTSAVNTPARQSTSRHAT